MPSANMTVTFTVAQPWPNFTVSLGPFLLCCIRADVSAPAMREAWRDLFIALRLGRRVWYYESAPNIQLSTEGDYWIVRRVLAPREGRI